MHTQPTSHSGAQPAPLKLTAGPVGGRTRARPPPARPVDVLATTQPFETDRPLADCPLKFSIGVVVFR